MAHARSTRPGRRLAGFALPSLDEEHPGTLTHTQVDGFNRDGYLKGLRVFSDAEAAGIRDYFDDLLARTLAAGGDSYSISSAHLRYGRVYDHPAERVSQRSRLGLASQSP